MTRRHKFNVSPREVRTWKGKVYDSKAEMFFAQTLAMLKDEIVSVVEQPVVMLDCIKYVPDFLVTYRDGRVLYIDVKGKQTAEFRIKLKLWKKYGPGVLRLVKQSGNPSAITGLPKFKAIGDYGPGVSK